jgi:hypothetical protein
MLNRIVRHYRLFFVLFTLAAPLILPGHASAQSAVKLINYHATVDIFEDGSSVFELAGVASHLGNFSATGDADFVEGPVPGSRVGTGVVVFEAANGDLLVGVVNLILHPPGADNILDTSVHF